MIFELGLQMSINLRTITKNKIVFTFCNYQFIFIWSYVPLISFFSHSLIFIFAHQVSSLDESAIKLKSIKVTQFLSNALLHLLLSVFLPKFQAYGVQQPYKHQLSFFPRLVSRTRYFSIVLNDLIALHFTTLTNWGPRSKNLTINFQHSILTQLTLPDSYS